MSADVIRFPSHRAGCIWILGAEHWLVLAPSGHGWAFGNYNEAVREARWLARNFGLPVREVMR